MAQLPPISSFKLNNILSSIQDDSIDQLTLSILNITNSYNNDLNLELVDSLTFQSHNINQLLIKNHRLYKNAKVLKSSASAQPKIDDEFVKLVSSTSQRCKELIEKFHKVEKLLPVKERLFDHNNSHRFHYPTLYEIGETILDLNDELVSLKEDEESGNGGGSAVNEVVDNGEGDRESPETVLDADFDSNAAATTGLDTVGDVETSKTRDIVGAVSTEESANNEEIEHIDREVPEEQGEEPLDPKNEAETDLISDKIPDSDLGPALSPLESNLQQAYPSANPAATSRTLKDQRISMLSKNIDDIISERAQQQQLQSMNKKPMSIIFPTNLNKKTSSQFNEDVRLILINGGSQDERQVIFGLKKFL